MKSLHLPLLLLTGLLLATGLPLAASPLSDAREAGQIEGGKAASVMDEEEELCMEFEEDISDIQGVSAGGGAAAAPAEAPPAEAPAAD